MEEKKFKELLKKLENDHGWTFYDEDNELHLSSMTRNLIVDVVEAIEESLLSKDREIEDLRNQIVRGEESRAESVSYAVSHIESEKDIEISRLKGLIDKAFEAGGEYSYNQYETDYAPSLETWKQQNNL
jgi:hypothetical protein